MTKEIFVVEAGFVFVCDNATLNGRWGEPKRKCTPAIFKSFIAKMALKMSKEKTWVQP